jgi:[ribosomal protein S18]-alanine N-acetyltransferase
MLIRFAKAEDLAAIIEIELEAEQAAHWSEEKYQELLGSETSRRLVLVLEDQGIVQGFGIAQVLDRECEIENLVIASNARRKGWGTKLLQRLIQDGLQKGADTFFLEVRESNLAARSLYNRCGFVENGRRKRYYREPEEDGILLTFRLPRTEFSR